MRTIVAIALLFFSGCTKANPNFCEGDQCVDTCTESDETCVCLKPPGVCVECTVDDERNCEGARPQCGDDNRCRGCRTNSECASGACLEDGSCAEAARIIYAAPNGVSTPGCGTAAGSNECSITQALAEVSATRDIIRLAAGDYTVTGTDGLDFSTRSATVVARGATITRAPSGPLMSARLGKTLRLIGGTLRGPNGSDGLRCNDAKLSVHEAVIEDMNESGIESNSCELTVSRSTIRRNLQGGINMVIAPRVATITNNFVYRNGLGSSIGGMSLLLAPGSKLEFNTVVSNTANATGGLAGGIACEGSYDAPFNLVWRNRGGLDDMVQVIGSCTFQRSYKEFAPAADNVLMLEDPNHPMSPSFRLTEKSPSDVRDKYDCRDLFDFEGDPRPAPTGGKCDLGADEYVAPPGT